MITSTDQIIQATIKYSVNYANLQQDEKLTLLQELLKLEWKLDRNFELFEVICLNINFENNLEKILTWLIERIKKIENNVFYKFLLKNHLTFKFSQN